MKTRTTSPEKPPEPSAAEVLGALDRRINALNERDGSLLTEQLALEKGGALPTEPSMIPNQRRRAAQLLNGEAPDALHGLRTGERLFAIIHERAAIAEAIQIGGSQRVRAEIARAAEIMGEHRAAWATIVRKRIAGVLLLREANREAEAFKTRMNELAGVGLVWPADPYLGAVFASDLDQFDPILGFFETCIREGFATEREIGR